MKNILSNGPHQGVGDMSVDRLAYSAKLSKMGQRYDPLTGEGELERKWLHDQPHYKLSFKDRIAPVDRQDHDMLREYLELLHIETTPKDYVIYAVHNIELMLDYAVIKIMQDRARFLSAV